MTTTPEPIQQVLTPEQQLVADRLQAHLRITEAEYTAYSTLCKRLDESYKPSARVAETYMWEINQARKLGQVRTQIPLIFTAVNLKSNVLGMRPPKFNFRPLDRSDEELRRQAEGIESVIDKIWNDEEMDEIHLNNARVLGLYGRSVFHDGIRNGQTFTENIDQQYNLWVSYRRLGEPEAMSFMEMVSEQEAMDLGWDGKTYDASLRFNFPIYGAYPHDDPLGIKSDRWRGERLINAKVPVIHFYFKYKKEGSVHYALFVNGQFVNKGAKNLKRKDWPFTTVECEHVPGLQAGVGDAEPLLDFQAELNERLSDWGESIRRNIKDQWKAWGLRHITPKMLPGEGRLWELTDKETDDIQPLKFPVDDVGAQAYINEIKMQYRRVSGIPEEAEAGNVTAGTSGFLATIKYQALITSLAPRRIRYQKAYKKWALGKLERVKQLYPEYKEFIDSARFILDVDWEEIAPRDVAQVMQTLALGTQSKLMSHYTAMEQLQLVPEDEMELMAEFLTDSMLNPEGSMAAAQAELMKQQVAMNAMAGQGGENIPFFQKQAQDFAMAGMAKGSPDQNQWNPAQGRPTAPGQVTESVGGRQAP